jgi:hypothetical protein
LFTEEDKPLTIEEPEDKEDKPSPESQGGLSSVPAPTFDKEDESWESDIPDDILEIVKENYKIIKKRGENANTWHKRVLANFMGVKEDGSAVDIIKTLDRQQLWDLSRLQNDRIKINGED